MFNLNLKLVLVLLIGLNYLFSKEEVNKTFLNSYAIEGYDTVAYFTEKEAVEGDKKFSYFYKDANWLFASQENLEKFKKDPEKYLPQYGGYCAYGMAKDYLAKIEPDQWTIVDEKLYLNYNKSVREKWLKNQSDFINIADKNWEKKLKE